MKSAAKWTGCSVFFTTLEGWRWFDGWLRCKELPEDQSLIDIILAGCGKDPRNCVTEETERGALAPSYVESGESSGGESADEHRSILKGKYRAGLKRLGLRRQGQAAPCESPPIVQMWLIDTGCGNDLVSRKEAAALKDFVRKGGEPHAA